LQLNKGLKTCRSVVANYRALLSSNDNLSAVQEPDEDPTDMSAEG
jgi:hypothetical protein